MVEHIWTVICKSSARDRDTGTVSLFEVLESIEITGKGERGALRFDANVMSYWTRSDPKVTCRAESRLIFCLPNGETAESSKQSIELIDLPRQISRTMVSEVPVEGPGVYKMRVELQQDGEEKWNTVASIPFTIALRALH